MGRYILCGREAALPYEVEELDLRIYTIEELCYYIYHNLPLISDDFVNNRLISFIEKELGMKETAERIGRFYHSPADLDATLQMLLSDVGYYSEQELNDFSGRLAARRRLNSAERVRLRADCLAGKKRYNAAIRIYRSLLREPRDGRMPARFYTGVMESVANCQGRLCRFDKAFDVLAEIYEQTGSERILKKMYDVSVLSGQQLPDKYFGKVKDEKLRAWQQDYWNRETVLRENLPENPVMQMFLKDPEQARAELREFVAAKKEEYRGMLE